MRLFVAIDLSPDLRLTLERLVSGLRPEAMINWSPLDNLHVTTKFIGAWSEDRLPEILAALQALASREPFSVAIRGLGWYPSERSPRVLWAGVEASARLLELASDTESALTPLSIAAEQRAYSPHLTLARIKNPVPLARLRQRVNENQSVSLGTLDVKGFALYSSGPGTNASRYKKIDEYHFENSRVAVAASAQ